MEPDMIAGLAFAAVALAVAVMALRNERSWEKLMRRVDEHHARKKQQGDHGGPWGGSGGA